MKKAGALLFFLMAVALSPLYSADIHDLEERVRKNSEAVANLKTEIIISEDRVSFFDLSKETSIDKINTNAGNLYLKVTDVVSKGNGYHAKVHIGNPLYATFTGLTINFAWRSSNEWIKRSVEVPGKLNPSSWTTAVITLSPVRAKGDLKAVLISLEVGNVDLSNNNSYSEGK
ncbi:MAG: hypothetical protein JJU12_04550 [Chlamydiales bacterium]|nr:hypothetical protein [Chlamydiales bacterium]